MERRRHLEAQIRQLRRELGRHPWLAARLADLLLAAGRPREAGTLLRKGRRGLEEYGSALMVHADLAEQSGDPVEADRLRERAASLQPGTTGPLVARLPGAREDSVRYLELLREAWALDQFSPRLNVELERAGLRRAAEYEQALRPTAAEAARREEQFRRLLDQHARGEAPAATAAAPEAAPEAAPDPSPAAREAQSPAGEPEAAGEDEVDDAGGEEDSGDELPPNPAARDQTLAEQAERLDRLTRPLHLPAGLPEDPDRRVGRRAGDLFDPRSMMTRRLARLYLEQGYPRLALAVVEALAAREPGAPDLAGLAQQAREAERRLAESPSPRRRR